MDTLGHKYKGKSEVELTESDDCEDQTPLENE